MGLSPGSVPCTRGLGLGAWEHEGCCEKVPAEKGEVCRSAPPHPTPPHLTRPLHIYFTSALAGTDGRSLLPSFLPFLPAWIFIEKLF